MRWEDAFSKFGYDDGDGIIGTWEVANHLVRSGYSLSIGKWGLHNILIYSLQQDGEELIQTPKFKESFGYLNPRSYLPQETIALLDKKFSNNYETTLQEEADLIL
ncbi:hypothetical protein [Aliikangiella sp. IMCC44359]|uniref:hypothetical protein n=1 Tax=Aliikangiella sp. IMCC44359 TaxID=3459125 RepID=UPI00403B1F52